MTSLRSLSVPCLAVLAALAAGCEPAVDSQDAAQPGGVGGLVEITTAFCGVDGDDNALGDSATCNAEGALPTGQLLIAYEVAKDTAPGDAELVGPALDGATDAAPIARLARDPELEDWLDAAQPAAAGKRWVGFRTAGRATDLTTPTGTWRAKVVADLDAPVEAAPAFAYRTVAFLREPAEDATFTGPSTDCDTSCRVVDTLSGVSLAGTAAIRDADLVAPADTVTAHPGTTATVPFTLA
ncbi:MAG TPA: hypothetical protein VN238_22085, partial [Solirubrobacteraceae bacterium]|nr:hypothetical protein [Solirubrobacteraceae bacterium]